jgi:flavodoxin
VKKAILFCYSIHHGNTRKIVDAVAERLPVRVVGVPVREEIDLGEYDIVGFASGIYMHVIGKPMTALIDSLDGLEQKDCFTMYTCGAPGNGFDAAAQDPVKAKCARYLGNWHCRGFDTYGPFKLIGGLAKGRPNQSDIEKAVKFVRSLLEQ